MLIYLAILNVNYDTVEQYCTLWRCDKTFFVLAYTPPHSSLLVSMVSPLALGLLMVSHLLAVGIVSSLMTVFEFICAPRLLALPRGCSLVSGMPPSASGT